MTLYCRGHRWSFIPSSELTVKQKFYSMSRSFVTFLVLSFLVVCHALAGDYEMIVVSDLDSPCAKRFLKPLVRPKGSTNNMGSSIDNASASCTPPESQKCRYNEFRPVLTSEELAQEFELYFKGQRPNISNLDVFFGNGHVSFCTLETRKQFNRLLIGTLKLKAITNLSHLYDFFYVFAGDELAAQVEQQLSSGRLSPTIAKRFETAKVRMSKARNKRAY